MAETEDQAHKGKTGRSAREETLEAQVAKLQADLQSITETLASMGAHKIDEARGAAQSQAQHLKDMGHSAVEEVQDEFGALEKQLKDTIREKPLVAVAGAVALGFLIAVLAR